jgi:NAD(P)-dependent dehydrogenase (short-subunit alcohol dehydrogenase family)
MMLAVETLNDKVALVTGASRGIGWAICEDLIRRGASVVASGRSLDTIEVQVEKIKKKGCILPVVMDVGDSESVNLAVQAAVDHFGKVDIVVNNAGVNRVSSLLELSVDDFDEIINVNLRGIYLVSRAIVPFMIRQGGGKIINIASQAGKVGEAFNSAYCASKFGVVGLTQSLARELAPAHIAVYAVCPGPVDTDMLRESLIRFAQFDGKTPEGILQNIIQHTAIGRLLSSEEVASLVSFLAADDNAVLTGASLQGTGGATLW